MLIKKHYYSEYLRKKDDIFSGGELVQSFIFGNLFIVAILKFYTSINSTDTIIVKVNIDVKEDVSSGYRIGRNLTNKEKHKFTDSIKNCSGKYKYKLIYIYE